MPGLAGFSANSHHRMAIVEAMRETMWHQDNYSVDPIFDDDSVSATRIHTNLLQPLSQPHSTAGLHIWLDGEFYNRHDLTPSSDNDPACLYELYDADPTLGILRRLDGMYSAVIYDANARLVHLVSDRYGLRPLYWTASKTNFAWASEGKALLKLPTFSPHIDNRSLEAFIAVGYLWGERTMFERIRRLPPGAVLTWNLASKCTSVFSYWSWSQVPANNWRDEAELAEELGALFIAAVERRCHGRTGVVLSGGFDPRAILAALPGQHTPTLTFGRHNSTDAVIAARVSALKGVTHQVSEINGTNWLVPRIAGVWHTDGMLDLMHMHSIEAMGQCKALFDIALNGGGGDGLFGGGHLYTLDGFEQHLTRCLGIDCSTYQELTFELTQYSARLGSAHAFYVDHRMRSFTVYGQLLGSPCGLEYRLPFMDNALQEALFAIPDKQKHHNRLYKQMLLRAFPDFYRNIPHQATGLPLIWPYWVGRGFQWLRRVTSTADRGFANYGDWIRQEPARALIEKILHAPDALYPHYVEPNVVQQSWAEHNETRDHSVQICRYLTVEIFLQQVFNGKWLPHR